MENETLGTLEGILGMVTGFGLSSFHSIQTYNLMKRAGMYVTDELGRYPELATLEGIGYTTTNALACFSLLIGGFYIGSKIGKFIKNYFNSRSHS
jgi:hypothetical protein